MIKFFSKIWENFKEYIVLILLVITSLIILSQNKNQEVQKVRAMAFGSFAVVTSIVSDLFNTSNIKSENEELRSVNAQLMLQISKLREYGILNEELRGLAGFKDTSAYPLIPATIVSKSLSRTNNTFTLNVGREDSVKPGMPVINDQGIVGIVHSVSGDFAIVRTLENVDLKLTVKNERSRIHGIMRWDGEEHAIINVPETYDFKPGDRIITSEVSYLVPVPIPVGIVAEMQNVETEIFSRVKVKPFANFLNIENVFVLGIVQSKQKENLELNFYNK
ncbi:MAG: rod shape-determining protein MreC [Ignavibacteriae bacterium]|nr:MAG: rod shape-determining protein MreC [Ignavibacteriota bacterium]